MREVVKYGGSSLKDSASTEKTLQRGTRHFAQHGELIEVVSAPGKWDAKSKKMTDRVREGTLKWIASGTLPEETPRYVKEHFEAIYVPLGLRSEQIESVMQDIFWARVRKHAPSESQHDLGDLKNQECYAAMLSAPESLNAALRAEIYKSRGIPAFVLNPQENIICTGSLMNASYDFEASIPKIRESFQKGKGIAIRPGFQGITRTGKIALFPRGGSDISGAIDAEALQADLYRNATDVYGVQQVDPRLFASDPESQAMIQHIPELSFDEVEELAISGASVIHPLAIAPLRRGNTPMVICHSQDMEGAHTLVRSELRSKIEGGTVGESEFASTSSSAIKGLAYLRGLGYVVLHSPSMIGEPGYLETFSEAFRRHNIDIEMVFTSPTIIAANTKDVDRLPQVVEDLEDYGTVLCGQDTGMVSIVGQNYSGRPAVAMRFLGALQAIGPELRIRRQTQAMTCSYWVSVDDHLVEPAARSVFHYFFGKHREKTLELKV